MGHSLPRTDSNELIFPTTLRGRFHHYHNYVTYSKSEAQRGGVTDPRATWLLVAPVAAPVAVPFNPVLV